MPNPFTFDPTIAAAGDNLARAFLGDAGTDRDVARARHYDALTAKARADAETTRMQRIDAQAAASALADAWMGSGLVPMTVDPAQGEVGPPMEPRPAFDVKALANGVLAAGGNAAQMGDGLNSVWATMLAAGGDEDQLRRSLVMSGKMPDADFAGTTERADQVSARNAGEDLRETVAKQSLANQGSLAEVFASPTNVIGADGKPVIVRQDEAYGQSPVLSETNVKGTLLSQSGMTPEEYVAQGQAGSGLSKVFDPASPSGIRLLPNVEAVGMPGVGSSTSSNDTITNATRSKAETIQLDSETTMDLINKAREVGADPRNFGAAGFLRETVQNAKQQGDAFGLAIGNQASEVQQQIMQAGDAVGLDHFDTNIPQLDMLRNILAYRLAKLQDPGGRISDADFKTARTMIGGEGMLGNQQEFLSRLDLFERMLNTQKTVSRGMLGQGDISPPPTPAPTNPTDAAAPKVQKWGRDAQGNPIRLGG